MNILTVVICVIATILLYRVDPGLGAFALVVTILNLFSSLGLGKYGRHAPISGGAERLVGALYMLSSLAGVVLLIIGLVRGC